MKKEFESFLNRYVFVPSNSARSWCPDCNNELKHNSKVCSECGSSRKSVAVQMHEPISISLSGKKQKRRKLRKSFYLPVLHLVGFVLLACILFKAEFKLIARIETLDWFFSTVTQAYIALIALLVAVTTFRLQSNHNERQDLGGRILEQLRYFIDAEVDGMSVEDAISEGKAIRNKNYTHKVRVTRIENLISRIKHIEQSSVTSKNRLKITFLSSVIAALSSLLFLIVDDYLFNSHLELLALLIVLEAVAVSTYYTWLLVKSVR